MRKRSMFMRKLKDRILRIFSTVAVLLALGVMAWLLCTVAVKGSKALSWRFFTLPSMPYGSEGGIGNAIAGTLLITVVAALIAAPGAVCAGIFLSEFKDFPKISAFMRFAANVTMGVPSILVGLFVYSILVVPARAFSGFAASVALAAIMFPVIMRTTEDMLSMVPYALRESALALGMTRTRATLAIVCKSASNGLATGILLAIARVSGETAPILFTAMYADSWPTDFFTQPTANLPALIAEYTTNSPFEAMHTMGWGAALVVTMIVLAINVCVRVFFNRRQYAN